MSSNIYMFELINGHLLIGQWGDASIWGEDITVEIVNPRLLVRQVDPQDRSRMTVHLTHHMLGQKIHIVQDKIFGFSNSEDWDQKELLNMYMESTTGLVLPGTHDMARSANTVVKFTK